MYYIIFIYCEKVNEHFANQGQQNKIEYISINEHSLWNSNAVITENLQLHFSQGNNPRTNYNKFEVNLIGLLLKAMMNESETCSLEDQISK